MWLLFLMRVLLVLNRNAAAGLAGQRWNDVSDLLVRQGAKYEVLEIEEARPIPAQVCQYLESRNPESYGAVAGIGGDGTHSAIINGLMSFGASHASVRLPPYAFIPLGTGNDIAKSLGIRIRDEYTSRDLRRAISAIVHGADYSLDLGQIGDWYFADALTVGVDSSVLRARNVKKRRIENVPLLRHLARGRWLYTFSWGPSMLQHGNVDVEVTVDGQSWYHGPMINLVVNNTRIYAGDFDFSSNAYADDGLLDVVLFTDPANYLVRYLLAIRHNSDRIRELSQDLDKRARHVQGRRILIQVNQPQPAQVDGEEWGDGRLFDVQVVHRALRIKIPAEPV